MLDTTSALVAPSPQMAIDQVRRSRQDAGGRSLGAALDGPVSTGGCTLAALVCKGPACPQLVRSSPHLH